jgi:ABC-type nitrate/sulfonate/bicarbonate transport system ATPase subunit
MEYKENETILYVKDLSAGYKDKNGNVKLIIKDINIIEKNTVREGYKSTGQTIAVLGRSGRGKSTLFKVLTGLLKPQSGEMLITDFSTQATDDAKTLCEGDVGFVDQKYTLFRHKTIKQICEYALRKNDSTKEDKEEMINHYLDEWGLTEHKDKYPCELSGGQRQRTAIIEQMLTSKFFMIFDEPFSGLDVGNIEKVRESFQHISDSHEFNTIIFSTHDVNLAVEMADSIYIVGFPEDTKEYSTIVKHYDLKKMGLAWKPYGPTHLELVKDIKETLLKS